MKSGRKRQALTEREYDILKILWSGNEEGMTVREIVAAHTEPRPHVNTVATIVKIMEEKGTVSHKDGGAAFRYLPAKTREDVRERSLKNIVSDFFNNSYKNAVSALVEEEKISIEELREIIRKVEEGR